MRKMSLAATVCAVLGFTGAARAEALKICTTDWPPFTIGQGEAVKGIHTEVVREAVKRIGAEAKIESVPWARCLSELGNGGYDVAYAASFRADRAEIALYPKTPLQTLAYVVVVTNDVAGDAKDLAKLPQPILIPKGYSIADEVKKAAGVQVEDTAQTDLQNLQKLLAGRARTAVVEITVAKALIKTLDAGAKLKLLDPPVQAGRDYFLLVSKKQGGGTGAQGLADRLDKVLAELKAEGFIEKVSAGY